MVPSTAFPCPIDASSLWKPYSWKILEEILRWDCDVLALQEVDHHHDFLSPMLAKSGYRSIFVKKPCAPGRAYDPALEDGCSLFYRVHGPTVERGNDDGGRGTGFDSERTTLELLDAHTFSFAVAEDPDEESVGRGRIGKAAECYDGSRPDRAVAQNQVAAVALLSVRVDARGGRCPGGSAETGDDGDVNLVIVATTHLKAAKDRHGETIRARQVSIRAMLLRH